MPLRPILVALALATVLTPTAPSAANWGAYLAADHAARSNDYEAAARLYTQALVQDPQNAALLEQAVIAHASLGDVERAVPIARRLIQLGEENQIANLVLLGDAAARGAWEAVLEDLEAGQSAGPLFDGLLGAWAEVGAGRMTEALVAFDEVVEGSPGVQAFGLYHKALALATAGDFEAAAEMLAGTDQEPMHLTGRGVLAYAEILSNLERNDEALALLNETFGASPAPVIEALRTQLETDEALPLTIVTSAADGVAEVFFSLAIALNGEASESYTLLYTRLAEHVRDDHIEAILMTAELLESLGQYDLATDAYRRVPRDHPSFYAAEMGRAAALESAGKVDASIEVLRSLAETHGDVAAVHVTLGDSLRRLERFEEARRSYDAAIALYDAPEEQQWVVYFARGIANERTDNWDAAEADFRQALELRANQPQVLNYLGYSFLELGRNYDEALDLIEKAVAAQPNSGYIVDSLGWAYYRLGRYEEAVEPLERAAELMPTDPVINDHLGDAYWTVGRRLEARFQWKRALSFDLEEEDAGRIRRKLEVGLDQVLAEEAEDSLDLANDG